MKGRVGVMDHAPHGMDHGPVARRASLDLGVAHDVVRGLMDADGPQAVLEVIAAHGYDGVHPATAALALVQPDGRLDLAAGIGVPEHVRVTFPIGLDAELPMVEAVAGGVPLWVESAADRDRWYPFLAAFTDLPHSGGFIPLDLADGTGGVLAVLFEHDRSVSELERRYYDLLANLCALAIDRLRSRS